MPGRSTASSRMAAGSALSCSSHPGASREDPVSGISTHGRPRGAAVLGPGHGPAVRQPQRTVRGVLGERQQDVVVVEHVPAGCETRALPSCVSLVARRLLWPAGRLSAADRR